MFRIILKEPPDIRYPLDQLTFQRTDVFYHGTRSCFHECIDRQGWLINNLPYNIDQIVELCNLLISMGLQDTNAFRTLSIMTLGQRDFQGRVRPSFTQNYWQALFPYALNPSGETITALLEGVEQLLSLNLDANTVDRLNQINTQYRNLIQNTYPVIYIVVLAEGEYTQIIGRDEVMAEGNVLPERIIARVDFPNGLLHFEVPTDRPPLPWDMAPFLSYLSEFRDDPIFRCHIAFFFKLVESD